jgi:hypothetical protein
LLGNPFRPVRADQTWLTSSVLDLARTIYDRHAFDALLDAGYDHQLVREHCRSGRQDARGCCVLDALLGLS